MDTDRENTGTLYLCATPIGNLEDITLRVLRVLQEVDLIAAEDTRHTRKLLNHYQIHTPLLSYHQHNRISRGQEILRKLVDGANIALVTDAGMPGIADPGADLVQQVIAAGLPLVALPGATALITALAVSGLPTEGFVFAGFPPRKAKEREIFFNRLVAEQRTAIIYESPHRLLLTLGDMAAKLGGRQLVVARELTKIYEEIRRGTVSEHLAYYQKNQPRGEFCLVLGGAAVGDNKTGYEGERLLKAISLVAELVALGVDKREAIRIASREKGVPKRQVYQAVIAQEKEK
ncbi:MAG: 16S rRNA (cytidine(1402)-2'-O)-methyltransferase [bacterium]|jgi:16S rRNA (cytidine1402-2'-O)-methyltransferase